MAKITDSSYVSVGLLITALTAVAGGAIWLTNVRWLAVDALAKGEIAEKKIASVQDKIDIQLDRTNSAISSIDSRLSRIEGKLDSLGNKIDRSRQP